MNIDFPLVLVCAVILTGIISLVDILFLAPRRQVSTGSTGVDTTLAPTKMPVIAEYARSFFPILLIVLLIRSFLGEPYRIPSGSLLPTLMEGDFILVNKFSYGLRLPITNQTLVNIGNPKRGDIVVFKWPLNPSIDYIKRTIGVPGDHISYVNKILYINGKKMPQTLMGAAVQGDDNGHTWSVVKMQEDLGGVKHDIYIREDAPARDIVDLVVPPHSYFMMGDNRDNSYDSRGWGFVPEANLLGKAILVWLSWNGVNAYNWDNLKHILRWERIGMPIH